MKKVVTMLVLVLFVSTAVFAFNTRVEWAAQEKANIYRWQLNGEDDSSWTETEKTFARVNIDRSVKNKVYVQSSVDGINWSASGVKVIPAKVDGVKKVVNPAVYGKKVNASISGVVYQKLFRDFYNDRNIDRFTETNSSRYGYGVGADIEYRINPNWGVGLSAQTSIFNMKTTDGGFVAIGDKFYHNAFTFNTNAYVFVSDNVSLDLSAGLGGNYSNYQGYKHWDFIVGLKAGLTYYISDSLSFTLNAGGNVTFKPQNVNEQLRENDWVVAPCGLALTFTL